MSMLHKIDVPDRSLRLLVLALSMLNLSLHVMQVPVYISILALICAAWRIAVEFRGVWLPRVILRQLIFAAVFGFFFIQNMGVFDRDTAVALIVLACSLKTLELHSYASCMLVCIFSLILLMTRLLSSQTIGTTVFIFVDIFLVTVILFRLHGGSRTNFKLRDAVRSGIRMFVFSSPLLILMFVFFPRISGGFLPSGVKSNGENGFSDSMRPGDISHLALSDELAFRVRFLNGSIPPARDLYWRGGEFLTSDGLHWSNEQNRGMYLSNMEAGSGIPVRQEIILEPRFRNWIFAFDVPIRIFFKDFRLQRFLSRVEADSFRLNHDLPQRTIYYVDSAYRPKSRMMLPDEWEYLTTVKFQPSEQILDLVRSWKKTSADSDEIVQRALDYFRNDGFSYSLNPGEIRGGSLDTFLFEKKVGFCEHYAGAFASLMRLAGIPAKVIVGFQGGVFNEFDGLYSVQSKDAHAWTEVWSTRASKWVRVDPTEVVAPGRIQFGGADYFSFDLNRGTGRDIVSMQELLGKRQNSLFIQTRLALQAFSTRWNLFLLAYDLEYQKNLLGSFGFENVNAMELFGVMFSGIALFILAYAVKRTLNKPRVSKEVMLLRRFAKLFYRQKIYLSPYETYHSYFERCRNENQDHAQAIDDFMNHYLALRYGEDREKLPLAELELKKLKNALNVKKFKNHKKTA